MNRRHRKNRKVAKWTTIIVLVLATLLFYTQLTIFIAPIGTAPDTRALVMLRFHLGDIDTKFIDNPDAMCKRRQGYADSICRSVVLNAVERDSTILLRLPSVATP